MAQAEHPDLDFGSIHATYDDIKEPVIQFDPTIDALPNDQETVWEATGTLRIRDDEDNDEWFVNIK